MYIIYIYVQRMQTSGYRDVGFYEILDCRIFSAVPFSFFFSSVFPFDPGVCTPRCVFFGRYILQLEQTVLLWAMKDFDVEQLQQKNRKLQHLVDSSQRLRKQEEDRHEEAKKLLNEKVEFLIKEIHRITPNEEVHLLYKQADSLSIFMSLSLSLSLICLSLSIERTEDRKKEEKMEEGDYPCGSFVFPLLFSSLLFCFSLCLLKLSL